MQVENTPIDLSGRHRAIILMIFGSVCISFGALVIRFIQEADAFQINFYRSIFFIIGTFTIHFIRHRRSSFLKIQETGIFGIAAGFLLALAGMSFLQAITNTTVAATTFTLSVIPFLTAALAWMLLKESLEKKTIYTMLLASLGIIVMITDSIDTGSFYGNFMAILCAIFFACYAILVRYKRNIEMLPALMISGVIIMALVLIFYPGNLKISFLDLFLCFLYGAVLSTCVNVTFILASKFLFAAELTLFMLLEFALSPIWVWLFISEMPTLYTIIGGSVVVLAVGYRSFSELSIYSKNRRRIPQNPL